MKPELRDYFAIHFAAALAREQRYEIEFIAGRAYDLAEAMLAERERRNEEEVAEVFAEERAALVDEPPLLDDDAPPPSERDEDLSWLEPPDEPLWERDDGPLFAAARPGLSRTQSQPPDKARKRGTGS